MSSAFEIAVAKEPPQARIPAELLSLRQWIAWWSVIGEGRRAQLPNGGWTGVLKAQAKRHKLPIDPRTGGLAASTRPATWSSAEDARAAVRKWSLTGIGFVFGDSDVYGGVDLDNCRDPTTGEIAAWAWEIILAMNSYTELSPSGTGVHTIVRGKLPDGKGNQVVHGNGKVEMFSRARYFTFTGIHVDGTPTEIFNRQSELLTLHDKLFATRNTQHSEARSASSSALQASDDELITRARQAQNGSKFERLWNGQWEGDYPSQSEADLALCCLLAFWTGKDRSRIDGLFSRSGMMRKKWLREKYRDETIAKAIAMTGNTWDRSPVPNSQLQVVLSPQFRSTPDGMFRVTTKGERLTQVQLTNYQAAITTNIRLDDGVETRREFEIVSELMGRKSRFTIPASEFASMDWPIERMGSGAITFPNQRDYARTAIQSLSIMAEELCVYTHTGWRNVDSQWLFLHAGGAVGGVGAVSGVNVRFMGPMSHYELRLPAGSVALASAVRASLKLTELGSPAIGFSLLAATYRAALGGADFAIHLAGETGAFKSEVAALHQQHFGAAMNRLHLPGPWSSTGNALEALAFHAKDALFVIDDFAPQGSSADVARYHAAADRVFRAAGNHAGRSRLDSTAKLRESKPPRSLILSTGEDVPRGQSVRARLLILELSKNSIDVGALTARQKDAHEGLYANAMGGFVQWLAGRYDEARAWFDRKISEYRARAMRNTAHARTPDIVANLQAGFELYLEFGVESGALDGAERDRLANRCWDALSDAAAAQAKHQAATEPTARFLALLCSLLTSGRAHLEARNGGEPERMPGSCGWRRDSSGKWAPLGECIGWVESDDLFLEPTAAYRVAQLAARDAGEALAISEQVLKKRLHERGLLASVDGKRETLTVRRSITGSSKQVLHFTRRSLLPEEPDRPDINNEGEG